VDSNHSSHLSLPFFCSIIKTLKGGTPMTDEGYKRKLIAILSAGVKGYSSLIKIRNNPVLSGMPDT
jgi:hypothetical protein